MKPPLRILLGPTASGKEALALHLAEDLCADIISVDSMKIYRGMNIGTATASLEDLERVRHWGLNIADPTNTFSLADYLSYFNQVTAELDKRSQSYLLSGGTPLYYKGLTEGLFDGPGRDTKVRAALEEEARIAGWDLLYRRLIERDPVIRSRIHPNDHRRIIRALEVITLSGKTFSSQLTQFGTQRQDRKITMVGLLWPRPLLYARIERRVDRMLDQGFVDEVRALHKDMASLTSQARAAVGYAELFDWIEGKHDYARAVLLIKQNTRRLAKNQMTWFRKFPCRWVDMNDSKTSEQLVEEVQAQWESMLSP